MAAVDESAKAKIDSYFEQLAEPVKSICKRLRAIILEADESIMEEWKWGPHYSSEGMVCGIGGFKSHVKLTFFNGCAMEDPAGLFNHCTDNEFSRSVKYTQLSEINASTIGSYVKQAVQVNKAGYKRVIKDKSVEIPADLKQALCSHAAAQKFFDELSYGYKKEFVEWITSAKRQETRNQRIAKVVDMCGEGKRLNEKYKN